MLCDVSSIPIAITYIASPFCLYLYMQSTLSHSFGARLSKSGIFLWASLSAIKRMRITLRSISSWVVSSSPILAATFLYIFSLMQIRKSLSIPFCISTITYRDTFTRCFSSCSSVVLSAVTNL